MADEQLTTEQIVEREVQRRVASVMRGHHQETAELQSIIKDQNNNLIRQHGIISRLTGEPLCFGTLIKVHNSVDPAKYKLNDEVLVIDRESEHFQSGGQVAANPDGSIVDEDGCATVKMDDDSLVRFAIGQEGKDDAQIRLTRKDDGTFAVVSIDGKPWEIKGVPDLNLKVGSPVKVKPDTKQIVCEAYNISAGPICNVVAVNEFGVEVMDKGEVKLVQNPHDFKLEEGDRVVCDPGHFTITDKLPKDARERYKLKMVAKVTWDDVGGLDFAKSQIQDAIELPFQQPERFKRYGIKPTRGILLHGPPGCGKTLLARVCAWAMAEIHGAEATDSGYIFVKGPEILNMWVGNTEAEIRGLFQRARKHYKDFGYKAILAIDEADAIMPVRGARIGSAISDTMVPQFLGEMDGIDEVETEANPIVVLMSNRPDMMDPAVTRAGRIDKHIKVNRPEQTEAIDILSIHAEGAPFADESNKMHILAMAVADLFSKSRLMYQVNNEHDFCLCHSVNGAMLESLVEIAKMNAIHRDIAEDEDTGVTLEDFACGIKKIYSQQRGLNHTYDLQDFAEQKGLQPNNMTVDRRFGSA
jgi:proteasome-associated ATPase